MLSQRKQNNQEIEMSDTAGLAEHLAVTGILGTVAVVAGLIAPPAGFAVAGIITAVGIFGGRR